MRFHSSGATNTALGVALLKTTTGPFSAIAKASLVLAFKSPAAIV
jgi:hypothetical protein